ncbi:MAG: homoserine kinase [Pseudomonadales bacterium]
MNAITKLDVLDLEHTLARYDVGDLIRYWPATNGIENSNYFVRTRDGSRERDFVLTIMEQPSNAGSAYVPLLDLCEAGGLPVAGILRNVNGEAIERHDGKLILLSRRLPGRHVYNPTLKQVAALGRFVARFHLLTANWSHPVPDYPRTAPWLAHHAELVKGHLPWLSRSLLKDSVREVSHLLARDDVNALPRGVIHGDLFRDNVLFNERGLTGVLDFHHASRGYLIYDLAVAANDWCTDSTGLINPDRATELVRAYHELRPLTAAEIRLFPLFALYGALAFWLSRLSVAVAQEDQVRSNNPAEFERIVAQHHAHFFYLDERLLV